jgi:6,7-dimethyl-8-ribityllumazine synthase
MATKLKKESSSELESMKDFKKFRIAIVVSEWNNEITFAMMNGAVDFLTSKGVKEKNIEVHKVPGSFELALGAQFCAEKNNIDAIITLGCVIQGETRHFDFICDACANGIMDVSLTFNKPVAFGVLTTENQKQAKERSGGKLGNKGIEAAETVLKMLLLKKSVK